MLRKLQYLVALLVAGAAGAQTSGPVAWQNDMAPIGASDWNYDFAAHLLERAGFGGTPEEIEAVISEIHKSLAEGLVVMVAGQGGEAGRAEFPRPARWRRLPFPTERELRARVRRRERRACVLNPAARLRRQEQLCI